MRHFRDRLFEMIQSDPLRVQFMPAHFASRIHIFVGSSPSSSVFFSTLIIIQTEKELTPPY